MFAAFSPDGRRIVTVSSRTVRLWDSETLKTVLELIANNNQLSAAFSFDGSRLVTTSIDGTAHIWDAASGVHIMVLRGHEAAVLSAAFSPDGSRIVTASSDKTARIWDAKTGTEIAVLRGYDSSVLSAAFSIDGASIDTASSDSTARIWDAHPSMLTTKALLSDICMRRLRGSARMTRDEMRLAGYPDSVPEIDVCGSTEAHD